MGIKNRNWNEFRKHLNYVREHPEEYNNIEESYSTPQEDLALLEKCTFVDSPEEFKKFKDEINKEVTHGIS